MDDIQQYVLLAHCHRAIGYMYADLASRGVLPPDYEAPWLLDLFGNALNKTLDISESSPIEIDVELARTLLISS